MPATCRSCQAPIIWAVSSNGNRMPVDREPHDSGNIHLLPGRGDGGEDLADVLSGHRLAEHRGAGVALHRSHFATCPAAAEHRR